jgi:hypothetical protein
VWSASSLKLAALNNTGEVIWLPVP